MGLPKITSNDVYGDDGKSLPRVTFEIDHDEFDKLRKIIDESECVCVEEPNPHNKNGQPVKHTDNRTGAVHLTYYGKKITDAIVISVSGPRTCLRLVLENGDREPYVCGSKDELEWFRKGLGFSSLDRNPFKL